MQVDDFVRNPLYKPEPSLKEEVEVSLFCTEFCDPKCRNLLFWIMIENRGQA